MYLSLEKGSPPRINNSVSPQDVNHEALPCGLSIRSLDPNLNRCSVRRIVIYHLVLRCDTGTQNMRRLTHELEYSDVVVVAQTTMGNVI